MSRAELAPCTADEVCWVMAPVQSERLPAQGSPLLLPTVWARLPSMTI